MKQGREKEGKVQGSTLAKLNTLTGCWIEPCLSLVPVCVPILRPLCLCRYFGASLLWCFGACYVGRGTLVACSLRLHVQVVEFLKIDTGRDGRRRRQ